MKPWTRLGEAITPDGKTVALFERDGTYSLRVNGAELMSTRQHASEERLAELVCSGLVPGCRPRVLIGGLGFGFTLTAALRVLPPDAKVIVAELMPAVVAWNKDPAHRLAAQALADRRTSVVLEDVFAIIAAEARTFDSIMLDVDNGPDAMVTAGNDKLYRETGLSLAYGALKGGGRLGVWSARPEPQFAKLMTKVGFETEVHRVKAHENGGSWHTLFVGTLPKKATASRKP
jgi:spermidine synthase